MKLFYILEKKYLNKDCNFSKLSHNVPFHDTEVSPISIVLFSVLYKDHGITRNWNMQSWDIL